MSFTKLTKDLNVHQSLGDEPNIDDGLSAEELKQRFDRPSNDIKEAFNSLIDELENITGASSIGAAKLNESDVSENNVQAKLNVLQEEYENLKNGALDDSSIVTSKISNGAITTDKIANGNVTTDKIADNNITTSKINNNAVTTEKINDGAVTLNKLDINSKKAENITATLIGAQDTSAGNVQAKLNNLQAQITGVSQGGVADNSIGTGKIIDNSVTLSKLSGELALFLIPSGGIIMWSGVTVPQGWLLCDGENGTPDLRDRFIVGSGNNYTIGSTGGLNLVTLSESQMPTHSHEVALSGNVTFKTGGYGSYGYSDTILEGITQEYNKYWDTKDIGIEGNCTCSTKGGGQAHENRPPYYALAFIMKA